MGGLGLILLPLVLNAVRTDKSEDAWQSSLLSARQFDRKCLLKRSTKANVLLEISDYLGARRIAVSKTPDNDLTIGGGDLR